MACHRPHTLTYRTAVYTPLLFITVHKNNMSEQSRSQGTNTPNAAPELQVGQHWARFKKFLTTENRLNLI